MIPEQLSLFGPPRPPKKIKEEELPAPMVKDAAVLPTPVEATMESPDGEPAAIAEAQPLPDLEGGDEALVSILPPEDRNSESKTRAGREAIRDIVSRETPAGETSKGKQPPTDFDGKPAQGNIPPDEDLFKRQYYSMRETAAMFEVTHSLLRFWENEFDILQPRKNKKGDRYFRPVDIKNLQLIYHLLRVRKFTIEGAKEYLRGRNKALDSFEMIGKLEKLKGFLLELKAHL